MKAGRPTVMRPDTFKRNCRSARRSARTIRATDGAYGGRTETARPHCARDLQRKEQDQRRTASHGQQWGVRDTIDADARMLARGRWTIGTAGGMAQLVQQRRRLREEQRNRCEKNQPVFPNQLQGTALHDAAEIVPESPAGCARGARWLGPCCPMVWNAGECHSSYSDLPGSSRIFPDLSRTAQRSYAAR